VPPSNANAQAGKAITKRIQAQVKRAAGKGLGAAAVFLQARLRETVGARAPTKTVAGKKGYMAGKTYRRALTPALRGAPPRVVSGELRAKLRVTVEGQGGLTLVVTDSAKSLAPSAQFPGGFPYPAYHEGNRGAPWKGYLGSGKHPWVRPTVDKYRQALLTVVGKEFKASMKEAL
jgi:hypothetical protein